jgi:hypothetical protein
VTPEQIIVGGGVLVGVGLIMIYLNMASNIRSAVDELEALNKKFETLIRLIRGA